MALGNTMRTLNLLRYASSLVIFLAASGSPQLSTAQLETNPPHTVEERHLRKADESVIQRARIGTPQEVLVILDDSRVRIQLREHRTALRAGAASVSSSLSDSDETLLSDETKKEIDLLKEQVFPAGQLGRIKILQNFSHISM
jgi:hypothetical protein